jgi:hypothetical protein
MRLRHRRAALAVALWCACFWSLGAQGGPSRRDAQSMKDKLAAVLGFTGRPASQPPRRTAFTETEVNAYLAYEAHDAVPTGVADPSVTILGEGRISGRAVVDLDAVRKAGPSGGLFNPRNFLRGRLPVTAVGVLRAVNGSGRFDLESSSVGGVPIPKVFLQEIVTFYSRTPSNPAGINLDAPFALPVGIRDVQLERAQAVVVQ